MPNQTLLIPVILSGGAGSRLWPVSREGHPKPFIRLPDGESLLQKTFCRAVDLPGVETVLTVTNRDYYFMTKDEYASCNKPVRTEYLLEPMGRNTAPAIALAALHIEANYGAEAVMLVLAADHLISNLDAFTKAVAAAKIVAETGHLVTFGITPDAPETGFGYIEAAEAIQPSNGTTSGRKVVRFVEKPSPQKAAEYLAAGNFYWNSGMFCFTAGSLLAAMEVTCPEALQAARACWAATQTESGTTMIDLDAESFATQPDISIDYAVMEKATRVAVVPCDLGWSDIGSWNALGKLTPPDSEGNRTQGETIVIDTRNTVIRGDHHLVAAVGVDDLVIIDTPDAVLVAHKNKTQDVKKVVQHLKHHQHEAYRLHRTVVRPWGTYTVLEEGPRFKIKRIEVKPGASLSLQMHHQRSEHWVVVSGSARVINGDAEVLVHTNESTYIPAGHRHRLHNPGQESCVMIEVQTGDYLGEDDIVRFQDHYGRV